MNFRQRLAAREFLLGTFVKTPSPIVVEVLGLTDLDCLCLDAEHAPFDRSQIDLSLALARAAGKPTLVRVPVANAEHILNALDCGATGIVAPHIRNAAEAQALAQVCHYGPGGRGYAGSSRAARYTTLAMADHLQRSSEATTVIAQIEDREAIEDVEAIAAVPGIDALFVGRADLTVAYGAASQDDPAVIEAVERVCAAGMRHGRAVGMFLARPADVPLWRERGATFFLLESDQTFLLRGAADLVQRARA